jgi:hypothetical protein
MTAIIAIWAVACFCLLMIGLVVVAIVATVDFILTEMKRRKLRRNRQR